MKKCELLDKLEFTENRLKAGLAIVKLMEGFVFENPYNRSKKVKYLKTIVSEITDSRIYSDEFLSGLFDGGDDMVSLIEYVEKELASLEE